jgi:4-hydroxy-2-oxoheptanedioate aldolase
MLELQNIARQRLERGEVSLGFGIRVARSVEIARAMRAAGFDWLFLDFEHGAMSIETAAALSIAGLDAGIAPLVRVPNGDTALATRLLDNGALGVVMPHIDTAEEARETVAALSYPPRGQRGLFSSLPQFSFGAVNPAALMATLNATNLIVVMIETAQGVANAEAIAAVPGVDVLLIGTNDLALDLGVPGELGHAKVTDAYRRVIAACRAHGKWPGMGGVYNHALMQRYVEMGCLFLQAGSDLGFMLDGSNQRTTFLRGLKTAP